MDLIFVSRQKEIYLKKHMLLLVLDSRNISLK